MFAISFAPGVTVTKWTRTWEERRPETPLLVTPVNQDAQLDLLRAGSAHVAFVRLPVVREGLSVITLYDEAQVVVLPEDHELAKADAVTLAQLDGIVMHPWVDARGSAELIAAGVGAMLVPHAIARQSARKGVVAVPVSDAVLTQIGLAWTAGSTSSDVEEFVGIVRGRSANSSRVSADAPPPPKRAAVAKKAAAEKRQAAAKKSGSGGAAERRKNNGAAKAVRTAKAARKKQGR